MAETTEDESQARDRRGDLLFLGVGLGALGLLLLLARELAPVTGVLTPELAGTLGVVLIVLGVLAAIVEVGVMFERHGGSGRSRRRGRGSVGPEAAVDLVVAVGGGDDGGASAEERFSAPAEATSTMGAAEEAPSVEMPVPESLPEPEPEPVGLALGAFGYVALSVRDRDHSLAWYAMVLGFEEVFRQDSAARRSSVMRFGSGGFSVGLVERVPSDGQPFDRTRTGLDHLAFAVRSRDELVRWDARLTELGVAHSPLADISPGAIVHLADPDGVTLALFWDRDRFPGPIGPT